jgi:hypothetical protein
VRYVAINIPKDGLASKYLFTDVEIERRRFYDILVIDLSLLVGIISPHLVVIYSSFLLYTPPFKDKTSIFV